MYLSQLEQIGFEQQTVHCHCVLHDHCREDAQLKKEPYLLIVPCPAVMKCEGENNVDGLM